MAERRFEVMNGIPREVPTSETRHQIVSLQMAAALLLYVERRMLGQVLQTPSVFFSREFILRPDILFIERGRRGLIGEKGLQGVPDVIIEIMSRDTRKKDLSLKRNIYSRFEVKEYWVVDICLEKVEVLLWSEWGYATGGVYGRADRVSSPALPGLKLPLRQVFENRV